jgi:hypothetical protein
VAQAIEDIIRELDAGYNPSRQLLQQRIDSLPSQADTQISGLNAQKDSAFNDILGGARDRGMGFSGIPIAEQAKYTATDFLPAVAKVRQAQNETQSSLLQALNDIGLDQRKTAYTVQQGQVANEIEAAKARAAERASAGGSGSLSGLFGGSAGTTAASAGAKSATAAQRADKGYNFSDAGGKAISAAQFAQLKGIPLRTLLQQMANSGDKGAKTALGYVGNDFNYNAAKVGNDKNVVSVLNSLLWGVNQVKAAAPAPAKKTAAAPKLASTPISLFSNPLAMRR